MISRIHTGRTRKASSAHPLTLNLRHALTKVRVNLFHGHISCSIFGVQFSNSARPVYTTRLKPYPRVTNIGALFRACTCLPPSSTPFRNSSYISRSALSVPKPLLLEPKTWSVLPRGIWGTCLIKTACRRARTRSLASGKSALGRILGIKLLTCMRNMGVEVGEVFILHRSHTSWCYC